MPALSLDYPYLEKNPIRKSSDHFLPAAKRHGQVELHAEKIALSDIGTLVFFSLEFSNFLEFFNNFSKAILVFFQYSNKSFPCYHKTTTRALGKTWFYLLPQIFCVVKKAYLPVYPVNIKLCE